MRTLTAVAIGAEYECHACGESYRAGLVRVPRAGVGGEAMADAASLPLPYPEAAIVAADTLAIQNLELAAVLPPPTDRAGRAAARTSVLSRVLPREVAGSR